MCVCMLVYGCVRRCVYVDGCRCLCVCVCLSVYVYVRGLSYLYERGWMNVLNIMKNSEIFVYCTFD